MLPLSLIHLFLFPAFSSFLFATVYHALPSQNGPSGTPFASGCSLDHKSQMTSHRQVQSPLHVPCRTLSYWLHLPLHASSPTAWEHTHSGCGLPLMLTSSSLPCSRCLALLECPFCLSIPGGVPHNYTWISLFSDF